MEEGTKRVKRDFLDSKKVHFRALSSQLFPRSKKALKRRYEEKLSKGKMLDRCFGPSGSKSLGEPFLAHFVYEDLYWRRMALLLLKKEEKEEVQDPGGADGRAILQRQLEETTVRLQMGLLQEKTLPAAMTGLFASRLARLLVYGQMKGSPEELAQRLLKEMFLGKEAQRASALINVNDFMKNQWPAIEREVLRSLLVGKGMDGGIVDRKGKVEMPDEMRKFLWISAAKKKKFALAVLLGYVGVIQGLFTD